MISQNRQICSCIALRFLSEEGAGGGGGFQGVWLEGSLTPGTFFGWGCFLNLSCSSSSSNMLSLAKRTCRNSIIIYAATPDSDKVALEKEGESLAGKGGGKGGEARRVPR